MDTVSDVQRRPSHQGGYLFNHSPASPPATTGSQQDKPFSLQNRRLQLRNTGFRGALLTPRDISPRLPGWRSLSSGTQPDEHKDNPEFVSFPRDRGSITSPSQARSASNILRELKNSTKRPATSPRRSAAALFRSSPSTPPSFDHQLPSRTPSPSDCRKKAMKTRDGSWKSPFSSLERPKRRGDSTRAPRRDTTRYIEHLETQLAATLNRADSTDAPTSSSHVSKIKSLTAEARVLKQELSEWEERFEDRVHEEIGSMVERETKFRTKVRALEKDTELKDNKIRELEWEVEMGNRRLRNLEAVKTTNRNLERRVDVLTELLAHSSVKPETDPTSRLGFDLFPPESDATASTARPKSMFSRIPLSPVRRPLFHSMTDPIPSILEEASSPPDGSAEGPFSHTRGFSGISMESTLDSGLGDSCSLASTRALESQRSSMMSHASSSSSFWGTSFPLSPELQGRLQNRQRQMRRFPSGSNSLKPLILPTATGPYSPTGNVLSPIPAQEPQRGRRLSREPGHDDYYLHDSASPKAHEATLHALEGNMYNYQTFEEATSGHTMSDALDATYSPFEENTQAKRLDSSPYLVPAESTAGSVRRNRCTSPRFSIIDTVRRARHMSNRDTTSYSFTGAPISRPGLENLATEVTWLPLRYIKDYLSHSVTAARRILINAWHANWTKFRKFTWWILGFVLSKQRRNTLFTNPSRNGTSCRQNDYGCASSNPRIVSGTRLPVDLGHSGAVTTNTGCNFELSEPLAGAHPLARTIQLWAKFSFALVLAVGLAVKDGPGSLMCDCLREAPGDPHSNRIPRAQDRKTVDIDLSDRTIRTPSPPPPPLFDPSDYTITPFRFGDMERDRDSRGADITPGPSEPG